MMYLELLMVGNDSDTMSSKLPARKAPLAFDAQMGETETGRLVGTASGNGQQRKVL